MARSSTKKESESSFGRATRRGDGGWGSSGIGLDAKDHRFLILLGESSKDIVSDSRGVKMPRHCAKQSRISGPGPVDLFPASHQAGERCYRSSTKNIGERQRIW